MLWRHAFIGRCQTVKRSSQHNGWSCHVLSKNFYWLNRFHRNYWKECGSLWRHSWAWLCLTITGRSGIVGRCLGEIFKQISMEETFYTRNCSARNMGDSRRFYCCIRLAPCLSLITVGSSSVPKCMRNFHET